MTINGDPNAPIKEAATAFAQAISQILGRCHGGSSAEDDEQVEVDGDLLTYRKTVTVTEIDVNLSALTGCGVTLIEALAEAFRGKEKEPDPFDRLAQAMETLRKLRETSVDSDGETRTTECEQCQNPLLKGMHTCEAFRRSAETAEAARRNELLNKVFGSAHVDQSMASPAIEQLVRRLERDGPDGRKVLDRDGLADAAAQLVAMIPEEQWRSMTTSSGESVPIAEAISNSLPGVVSAMAVAFVPEPHRQQVIEALMHAAQQRLPVVRAKSPDAPQA